MATVDDILHRALPAGSTLVAGRAGTMRRVDEVLLLRPRPPGLPEARGREFILLSLSTLQALDETLTLARAVDELSYRATALGIRGIVSEEARARADALSLPLVELPAGVPLTDVERDVIDLLAEERNARYRRRHTILHDLASRAVRGEGVDTILQRLGEATGYGVMLTDNAGSCVGRYRPDEIPADLFESLTASPESAGQRAPAGHAGLSRHAIPVAAGERRAGMLVVLAPVSEPDEDVRAALEAGATAAAIELTRAQAVRETVTRIQGDLVADILMGREPDTDLEARARRLGHDLTIPRAALVLQGGEDIFARLSRILSSRGVDGLLHTDGTLVTVFYPVNGANPQEAERLGAGFLRDLHGEAAVRAGVSTPHSGVTGLRVALEEAQAALSVARLPGRKSGVTTFADLGVYRLLLRLRGSDELRAFHDEMLGPLLAYDRARNTVLISTLEAFLTSANATEAAERLTLHRNSLLYRLRRIRDISALDLDDPETRLALLLALKIGPLL
jgi:purine catabolism regulator